MVDNGAPAGLNSPPPGGAPSAAAILQERRAPQRDSLLVSLQQLRSGGQQANGTPPAAAGAAVAGAPVSPAADGTPAAAAAVQPETPAPEAPAEPAPSEQPAADPAATPAPAAPATPDPDPPALVALRKQEQHLRTQIAQERQRLAAEAEQLRIQHQARVDKAAAVEAQLAALRQDPTQLLQILSAAGYTDADYDAIGKLVYGHSPEGQKQPGYKAQAGSTLAQRKQAEKLEAMEQRIAELTQSLQQRDVQAQAQAQVDRFYQGVVKAVDDATPLAKAALAKNPDRTRDRMLSIADRLYLSSGPSDDLRDIPSAADVLRAYEAEVAAELADYGVDPKAFVRAPAPPSPPKPAATIAPATTAAPTPPAAPAAAQPPQTAPVVTTTSKPKPTREEFLADLAAKRSAGML